MKILRLRDVCEKVGWGRSTLLRRIEEGVFPQGKKCGGRTLGWTETSVDNWIAENYKEAS